MGRTVAPVGDPGPKPGTKKTIVPAKDMKCPVCKRQVSRNATGNILLFREYEGDRIVENVWVHRKCLKSLPFEKWS